MSITDPRLLQEGSWRGENQLGCLWNELAPKCGPSAIIPPLLPSVLQYFPQSNQFESLTPDDSESESHEVFDKSNQQNISPYKNTNVGKRTNPQTTNKRKNQYSPNSNSSHENLSHE